MQENKEEPHSGGGNHNMSCCIFAWTSSKTTPCLVFSSFMGFLLTRIKIKQQENKLVQKVCVASHKALCLRSLSSTSD